MAVNISGLRRNIKNVAHNYTDAQVKVREATSNDPWGPSSTMMSEIADLTYNVVAFSEIMQMVWKRLNDQGKNWRHVYKALVLLEYLIKTGSEKVAQQCKENIFAIQTLKDFQYLDDNKDQGINVREKAKALVALLKDDERLRNERVRALKAKERFAQSTAGIGSDTVYNHTRDRYEAGHHGQHRSPELTAADLVANPELEAARPQTAGEEELQLQLALAMSREEAEQDETKLKSDDMRLQLALQKSQQEDETKKVKEKPSSDLLDLDFGNPVVPGQQQQPPPPVRTEASLDPWGMPPPDHSAVASHNDPWGAPALPVSAPQHVKAGNSFKNNNNNDPWSPPPPSEKNTQIPPLRNTSPYEASFNKQSEQDADVVAENDPWTAVKKKAPSTNNNNNNITKTLNLDNPESMDLFSPTAQNQLQEFDLLRSEIENQEQQKNGAGSPNPFDMNELGSGMDVRGNNGASPSGVMINANANTGAKPKQSVKTLLGEHSKLVNLDDLVSANTPARNPFEHQQQNPFQVKSKKPPLTELMNNPSNGNWGASNNQQHQQAANNEINPFF